MNTTKFDELNRYIESLYTEYRIIKHSGQYVDPETFALNLECLFASIQGVANAAMKLEEVESHEN